MERRDALLKTAGLAGASLLAAQNLSAQMMGGEGAPVRFGSTIIPPEREKGVEKHVPFIDAPEHVSKGEKFNVTVQVGRVVPHPNTLEHHIKTVELYALADGSPYVVKIGTVELGPTFADPTVNFTVMLQNPSTLYALSYCNIHGVWDNQVRIHVM
ncbi:class II SORL domain-containing protein [Candidatus Latescibacterota bacterium]